MPLTSLNTAAGTPWEIAPADDSGHPSPQAEWIPATVPGNVQADLEQAGRLAPLRYGLGDRRLPEVARRSWWYRTRFIGNPRTRTTLVLDGVDFSCDIRVNDQFVGSPSGTFRRTQLDITSALRDGENELAVLVHEMPASLSAPLEASDGAQSGAETEHFFVFANNEIRRTLGDLKSPATTSYDWGTNVWALGIWRDVWLQETGPARVDWLRVRTELSDDHEHASIRLDVEIDSTAPLDVSLDVHIEGPDGCTAHVSMPTSLPAGSSTASATVQLAEPHVWWPLGHGEQALYAAHVSIRAGEKEVDVQSARFGIRAVSWQQVDGAAEDFINPFALHINGRRVRTMGSNLVSPDLLFGRNDRRGDRFLHAAAAAGVAALRVHGGGVVLPPRMYDLADELGLLILQEFPLGNCRPESDPAFLTNLQATATSIVRQLRNHPSLIEWSGGNELHWRQGEDAAALQVLNKVVDEEDGRIFRATCPMQGSRHSPWYHNRSYSYRHYNDESMTDNIGDSPLMRYGEFGTQAPANFEVWRSDVPAASRWPIDSRDEPVLVRKNGTQAVFSDEHWLTLPLTEELFGVSRKLESMIRAGQFLGAEGLRYAVDQLRRRGRRLGGFTTWDFNEPWPNLAGSYVIDYDGRPLLGYDFLAQALAPVAICLRYDDLLYDPDHPIRLDAAVVNDTAGAIEDLRWSWTARDRRGTPFATNSGEVPHIAAIGVVSLPEIVLTPPRETRFGPLLLELQLRTPGGHIVAERMHIFGAQGVRAPLRSLLTAAQVDHDDDEPLTAAPGDPRGAANLAYAGNGARLIASSGAECRDDDPRTGLIDGRYCTPMDGYGSGAVWNSTTPEGWFEIELADEAPIGRVVLGRDRSGTHHDRTVDHLRIEASVDRIDWKCVYEGSRLAAMLGDRTTPKHEHSNPGAAEEFAALAAYRPTWSLEILFPAEPARYLRVTAAGRPDSRRYVAFDEIEVYASAGAPVSPEATVIDHRELDRSIGQTTLRLAATRMSDDADGWQRLDIDVENAGPMTALFCTPRPLLEDRTDLIFGNRSVSIPRGERRTVTVRCPRTRESLSLDQLGWTVEAWNAEPVILRPGDDVIVALGRRDGTSNDRGVLVGAADTQPATIMHSGGSVKVPIATDVPGRSLELHLHVADCSASPATLGVGVGGRHTTVRLRPGLGRQLDDPEQLGHPQTALVQIPADAVTTHDQEITIRLLTEGWVSWDAIHLIVAPNANLYAIGRCGH